MPGTLIATPTLVAILHAQLRAFGADYADPEHNPAAGMEALVDALFMELLSIARPAPDTRAAELRRSRGFALGALGGGLGVGVG